MNQLPLLLPVEEKPGPVLDPHTDWMIRQHNTPSQTNPGCGVKCQCGAMNRSTFVEVLAWSNGYDIVGRTGFLQSPVHCLTCGRILTQADFDDAWCKPTGRVMLKYPYPDISGEITPSWVVQNMPIWLWKGETHAEP